VQQPKPAAAPAPARGGSFGARVATLSSGGQAQTLSANAIGGGLRPFGGGVRLGDRVGRLPKPEDEQDDQDA